MASFTRSNQLPQSTSDNEKGRFSKLNFNFLKIQTEKKTQDGQLPKRPGPKPGNKPALTNRREKNRQAQRTHRERKELYIKALEDEILRMKEVCSNMSRDKAGLTEENRQIKVENHQLKALLSQNGIDAGDAVVGGGGGGDSLLDDSMNLGSHATAASGDASVSDMVGGDGGGSSDGNLDYNQAGIDFVLTLEKPCMAEHIPWLLPLERANSGSKQPCGHALMASCPPEPFPEISMRSSNYANKTIEGEQQQPSWELTKADLATLLDLSRKLNLDGEITPVMAWGMMLAHPRLGEFGRRDFGWLTEELGRKVKCYGFGAVMEEFEVRDAFESILSTKVVAPGTAY